MPLRPRKFTLPVWMRIPLAAIALLAVLPIFSKVAGFSFLPSSDWIAKIQGVSILAGGIAAIFTWWVAVKIVSTIDVRGFRKTMAICIALILGFKSGETALVVGVPALAALTFGQQVELAFLVSASGSTSRSCAVPIDVAGMPFFFGRICLPSSASNYFQPGSSLLVQGRGTEMGVFVDTLRAGS